MALKIKQMASGRYEGYDLESKAFTSAMELNLF